MLMKVVLVIACLAATAYAGCNSIKRLKVKNQWATAFGYENARESFDDEVWLRFFELKPDAREKFFTRVRGDNLYSPEFRAHGLRVIGGLDMVLSLLDDNAAFEEALAHLKTQHASLAISADYNAAFKQALMESIASHVGRCFDFDAWNACFDIIYAGIQS